jgi:anthranilate phosphoribosyltransferase
VLTTLTEQLTRDTPLAPEQVAQAVVQLVDERVSVESKADFLTALARKGETTEEIAAFARELREKSIQPPLDAETRARDLLDVCGTGGDHLGTFNISTTVAILAAAAGVTVAKHGNRAITSRAGSADVLEALGIKIELAPEEAARWLREHGFAFFFAPKYHPAFKHIGPARKLCAERGQRTIFNFLGPLLNPARPTAQLVGVPKPELCEPIARVLQALGLRRGMVVSGGVNSKLKGQSSKLERQTGGARGAGAMSEGQSPIVDEPSALRHLESALDTLDELSTLGENTIAEFYQDRGFAMSTLSPHNFPLQPTSLDDLKGGDRQTNAEIVRHLLRGEDRGPKRDAVLLNAAAALFIAGRVKSMNEGWELATELIDGGAARARLEELIAASR